MTAVAAPPSAEERLSEAVAVLVSIQWSGARAGVPACPRCGALQHAGHLRDCAILRVLRGE